MPRTWRAAGLSLACVLLAAGFGARAAAAVLPQNVIDVALASAKNLKRESIPTSLKFPYVKLGGSEAQGFVNTANLDYGYLAGGNDLLIVPLDSGGSGGVFFTLLFSSPRAKPAFVGPLASGNGHLDVHIQLGQIVARTPVYGKNAPNCCPSGYHVERYTLEHGKLKKLAEYNEP